MNEMNIAVVIGTARAGRQTESVAKAVAAVIGSREGVTTELVDVKDHITEAVTVPPWGEGGADADGQESAWKEIIERSQALVLVIPEYNHGYPGELKLLLDSLWKHYKGMPVALVGVSAGTLGGARVLDHIKPILIELNLHPLKEAVTVPKVKEAIAEDGTFANEKTVEYVNKLADALVDTAQLLKPLRN